MKIVPLTDNVVVRRLTAETQTAGGILLPDAAQEKPTQGRVLSVGGGQVASSGKLIPMQVSDGDRVLFSSYAGTEIEVDGETLLIMRESEILGVLG